MIQNNLSQPDILYTCRFLQRTGEKIMQYYNTEMVVVEKSDNSPVTEADEQANQIIVSGLKARFNDIPIVSEEIADSHHKNTLSRYWIIDPLDGTREFLNQTNEFTINIALISDKKPIAGFIHLPASEITYVAQQHGGFFTIDKNLQQKKVCVQKSTNPNRINFYRSKAAPLSTETEICHMLRKAGYEVNEIPRGAALKHIDIAKNENSIYIKLSSNQEWDTAPGQLFIEECGGNVIDIETNEPVVYGKAKFNNNPMYMVSAVFPLQQSKIKSVIERTLLVNS